MTDYIECNVNRVNSYFQKGGHLIYFNWALYYLGGPRGRVGKVADIQRS